MTDQGYLTARIGADGGPETRADHGCVPWWSFTKTALATAALQLVGRGHFRLDDWINSRPFTLRQLLQHRAGVPNYGGLASYHEAVRLGEKPWEIGQLLDRVAVDRLDFDPGHGWRYSNVGYLFVRQLIEEAVGREIGSALRYLVFDDLGLESVRMAMVQRWLNHFCSACGEFGVSGNLHLSRRRRTLEIISTANITGAPLPKFVINCRTL